MTISVRPEEAGDEAFLRRLIIGTIGQELGAEYWPEGMRHHLLDIQYAGRRQAVRNGYPTGQSRIVLVDGAEAGWLYVAESSDEVRLVEIMLLAEHRGKGVGARLIREVIAGAGGRPVRLLVNAMNPRAAQLYERLGFRRTGGDEVQHLMEYSSAAGC